MIDTIHISEVIVGERQRKEYNVDRIAELADSIQEVGLLHAPRLRSFSDPVLIAGGCRLRAMKIVISRGHRIKYHGEELPEGHVPYTVHHTDDDYEVQVAELYENIHRTDLTWQEKTTTVNELHALRKQRNPNHTVTQTAREIFGEDYHSSSSASVSEDVRIAEAMRTDPEIAKAKTKKDAKKLIQKKAARAAFGMLHEAGKSRETSDDSIPFSPHTLKLGDACELLGEIPDETFSCILTDPPYGISADHFGDQGQGDHDYDDSPEYVDRLLHTLAVESFRVATDQAHAYVFCDIRVYPKLAELFRASGWYVWATPLIWYKGNQGLLPRPDYGPRRCYEAILYAIKGERKVLLAGQHDVISVAGVGAARHAAEKPVELYVNLLNRSCHPGDRVLDPFAGSGTIFPAANRCDLKATGFNLDSHDYALAQTRLEES